jgi:exonuclease III
VIDCKLRVASWNVTGLPKPHSHHLPRAFSTYLNIARLAKTHAIILLQEVRIQSIHLRHLLTKLPHFSAHLNSSSTSTAGTLILTDDRRIPPQHITHNIIAPDYIHSIDVSVPGSTPFSAVNTYIDPSGGWARKRHLINRLTHAHLLPSKIIGGDWNFVTATEDSSSHSAHYHLSSSAKATIHAMLTTHTLTAVPSDTHTHFRATNSARLDRFYTSLSEAQHALHTPAIQHTIAPSRRRHLPSQPVPISLTFTSTAPPPPRKTPHIPKWVVELPLFEKLFRAAWAQLPEAQQTLGKFKRLATTTSSLVTKHVRTTPPTTL